MLAGTNDRSACASKTVSGDRCELAEQTLRQRAEIRFRDTVAEIVEASALEVLPHLVTWTVLSSPLRRRDCAHLLGLLPPAMETFLLRCAA